MKGKIKHRLLAIVLCIAMLVTSVNLTNLFNNKLNAASTVDEIYFTYTGDTQTYIVSTTGYYILETYGGQGGDGGTGTNAYGGKGGYVKSKVYLTEGTILYINVGGQGASGAYYDSNNSTVVRLPSYHNTTFNGGGAGYGTATGDGGGATDIRINNNNFSSLIQISGGGGGASYGFSGTSGGSSLSGNNNVDLNGSSAIGSYGGGGGGGYKGGTPGVNYSTSAKGGSNYFDSSKGMLMSNLAGENTGAGMAKITFCQNYSLIINPNGGIFNGSTEMEYREKDTTTSSSTSFSYTGGYQSYVTPENGIYKFEVWGAQGGASNKGNTGGYGGYAVGFMYLEKGKTLYVTIGGQGSFNGSGGWNGGGNGGCFNGSGSGSYDGVNQAGGGGGATHISFSNGLLTNSSVRNNLILAAGGGGGASTIYNGGAGGGTSGTKGQGYSNAAGTQSSGASAGAGSSISGMNNGGGGGGWYGGYAATNANSGGGSGGSGRLSSSLTNASMSNGARAGNGYAKISYCSDCETIDDPTREGYTFTGWTIEGNGILSGNIFEYSSGLTILTANWTQTISSSTLTIDPNGGVYEDSLDNTIITKDSGTQITIDNPTREGYTFIGWTKTGGGTLSDTLFTFNTTDAMLVANWSQITSTLTINPNTGNYNNSTENTIINNLHFGDKITISQPNKFGYTFNQWNVIGVGAYWNDSSTLVMGNNNITLIADYSGNEYTIKYDLNNISNFTDPSIDSAPTTVAYDSTFTVSNPTMEEYVFTGWTITGMSTDCTHIYGSNSTTATSLSNIKDTTFKNLRDTEGTVTFKANWEINQYNVTYIDLVKGTSTQLGSESKKVDYNTTVAGSDLGTDATIGNYYYGYQYDSCTSATVGTSGATVYRYFVLKTADYKIIHQQEQLDGTYKTIDTENLTDTIGSSITPNVKTYEGFTSPSTQTVVIKEDGSTTVTYKYTRNKYPVTYIDVIDTTNGKELGKSTDSLYFEATVTGATKGTDLADNAYYNGYYYSSCTTATVGTSGATVYRIFKLRTIDINGSVNWNDKSNTYSSRPNNVTIYLYRNGQQIDTYTGLTGNDNNSYSFKNLQKYDTSTGATYTYTVSQSNVLSNNNPEDKYTTTVDTAGFNFTNTLDNSAKEDPEPEWVGFEVSGSIVWEDYDDKLGTRPSEITLTLYQNGVAIKTQVVDKTATGYSFVNLDKYDDYLNPYTYKVEETFTARALTWNSTTKQYEEIDAYTITVDGFDFTNTLVDTKDKPIIEVKPDHNNGLVIKLNFNDSINWLDIEKSPSDVISLVALKQLETIINDGNISYTSNYNGMEYNVIVTEAGVSINNIPSGKYEIVESNDNTFILEGIDLQTTSSISVVNENNKWYLIIAETNKNQTGTITLNMNADSFNGIDSATMVDNLYSLKTTSPMQVMMLSMFSDEITVPEYVEPTTHTITYKDCDVADDTKYSENSEATLKDCDIKNFLGWSENSEATEPQYLAGDTITMEKDIVLYPVIESVESTEDVGTITEEESTEEEETETESSETTESEEPLEKNSAFSE